MAKRFYTLEVAGVRRELPILNVTEKLAIAGFIMLGDVELTDACARALAKRVPQEMEVLLTAETKGIPLAAELVAKAGGTVVGEACVLAEGKAAERKDLIFLEALPLFEAR